MKRNSMILRAGVLAWLCAATVAWGADPKEIEKVSIDQLTHETQKSTARTSGEQGLNVVWFVPVEFWHAALLQNPDVTPAQVKQTIDQMKGVCIVAVVRGRATPARLEFFDEESVRKNLKVEYTDKEGKKTELQIEEDLTPATAAILAAMKPMLKTSMGNMGQSMYFFVFNDKSETGARLVNPYSEGKLEATLGKLKGESGGAVSYEFPLNSLYVPRVCTKCHHENMDIHWKFCPFCGGELAP